MSIVSGLSVGPTVGLEVGLNPSGSSIVPFPESASGFFDITGATPDHIYSFQESSGDILDKVASSDLSTNSVTYAEYTGLPDGSVALRFSPDGSSDTCDGPDVTTFNPGSDSVAFVITLNVLTTPAARRTLFQKFISGKGYRAEVQSTAVRITVDDSVAAPVTITRTATLAGNGWVTIGFVVNRTDDTAEVHISSGVSESGSISALSGDLDTATPFFLGFTADSLDKQVRYFSVLTGSDAEAINLAAVEAFHEAAGL